MKFGSVDINDSLDWSEWKWKDFLSFYESSLKGNVTETPEEIAIKLGVKVQKTKKAEKSE